MITKKNTYVILASFLFLSTQALDIYQSTTPVEKSKDEGKQVFERFACNSCHGNSGEMEGDFSTLKERFTAETLPEYINNPQAYDNKQMPVYDGMISDSEMEDLVAYLFLLGEELNRSDD